MNESHVRIEMPLFEAIVRSCNPRELNTIKSLETCFTAQELLDLEVPNLSGALPFVRKRDTEVEDEYPALRRDLRETWDLVLDDIRERMRRQEILLSGVLIYPSLTSDRVAIPGAWASECIFGLRDATVSVQNQRYADVRVSDAFSIEQPVEAPAQLVRHAVTVDDVPALSYDVILALLEEHAKQVIADPDAQLFPPGRISFMPIIRGKMRHRAENGEMLSTITAESKWLANWISTKVTLHQIPTDRTIAKSLGSDYEALKPTSKADIRKSRADIQKPGE